MEHIPLNSDILSVVEKYKTITINPIINFDKLWLIVDAIYRNFVVDSVSFNGKRYKGKCNYNYYDGYYDSDFDSDYDFDVELDEDYNSENYKNIHKLNMKSTNNNDLENFFYMWRLPSYLNTSEDGFLEYVKSNYCDVYNFLLDERITVKFTNTIKLKNTNGFHCDGRGRDICLISLKTKREEIFEANKEYNILELAEKCYWLKYHKFDNNYELITGIDKREDIFEEDDTVFVKIGGDWGS